MIQACWDGRNGKWSVIISLVNSTNRFNRWSGCRGGTFFSSFLAEATAIMTASEIYFSVSFSTPQHLTVLKSYWAAFLRHHNFCQINVVVDLNLIGLNRYCILKHIPYMIYTDISKQWFFWWFSVNLYSVFWWKTVIFLDIDRWDLVWQNWIHFRHWNAPRYRVIHRFS